MREETEDNLATGCGMMLAPIVVGLFLLWYNHVISQLPIKLWQWCILAVPVCILRNYKPVQIIFGLIFAIALIGQFAAFAHLITLPLLKGILR